MGINTCVYHFEHSIAIVQGSLKFTKKYNRLLNVSQYGIRVRVSRLRGLWCFNPWSTLIEEFRLRLHERPCEQYSLHIDAMDWGRNFNPQVKSYYIQPMNKTFQGIMNVRGFYVN